MPANIGKAPNKNECKTLMKKLTKHWIGTVERHKVLALAVVHEQANGGVLPLSCAAAILDFGERTKDQPEHFWQRALREMDRIHRKLAEDHYLPRLERSWEGGDVGGFLNLLSPNRMDARIKASLKTDVDEELDADEDEQSIVDYLSCWHDEYRDKLTERTRKAIERTNDDLEKTLSSPPFAGTRPMMIEKLPSEDDEGPLTLYRCVFRPDVADNKDSTANGDKNGMQLPGFMNVIGNIETVQRVHVSGDQHIGSVQNYHHQTVDNDTPDE